MKILVTGGAGFIGSCFIRYMLNKYPNYKIINLDILNYAGNLENLKDVENNPNYTFVKGDICDFELVNNLSKQVNCVINFAAQTHVDNSIECSNEFIRTNIQGTHVLLECARINNLEKFIQISTDEVYGSIQNEKFFTEYSPLAPNNPYSASKASADLLVRSYYKTYGLPAINTRCTNNFGEYQYPEKLIPCFISKLLKDQKVPIYGDGLQIRDWLYVYDHASAIDIVLHKGIIGEIYNISGRNEKTNLQIVKLILNELGKSENYISFIQDRLGHDRHYSLSNDKILKLGWKINSNFEEKIKHTINWYLNNQDWIRNIERKL